jgi:hypothetical protein
MNKFRRPFDISFDWNTFKKDLIGEIPTNFHHDSIETFAFEPFFKMRVETEINLIE